MKHNYNSLFNKALNGGKTFRNIFYRFALRILLGLFVVSLISVYAFHISKFKFNYYRNAHVYLFTHVKDEDKEDFLLHFEEHAAKHPSASFEYIDTYSQTIETLQIAEKYHIGYDYYRVPGTTLYIRSYTECVVIENAEGYVRSYSYKGLDTLDDLYRQKGWVF